MNFRIPLTLALMCITAMPVVAEDLLWTGNTDSDFLTSGNWDGGAPTSDEDVIIIEGGANLPVVIPQTAETITIGAFQLGGDGDDGGHVVQNGGTLIVSPLNQDGVFTDFEFKSHIGDKAIGDSSWTMNNNAVMLYDAPLDGDGAGLDTDGENGFDLEVGAGTGEGVGSLFMNDNSILRISDDLKIGAEDDGNGNVVMTGNAIATIGSGISVGEKPNGVGTLNISGNAMLVSGNSAGPGQAATGRTDEGYLALSTNSTGTADVTISDTAKLYVRTLQQRAGETNMTIEGAGQFHVFDVFENEAPDLGNATVAGPGSGPQRTSHVGASVESVMNLTIKDDGVMSVDSDLEDSLWSGLAVSGGTNRGANDAGGATTIEVRDRGSLTIQQDLHLTLGDGEAAESTLRVVGPDADVAVNGSLFMALGPDGEENIGTAALHSVITGSSHSTISVAGDAEIGNGLLLVDFEGYSPRGGEAYNLLQAGSVGGDAFLETTLPELPEGLDWDLSIDDTSVMLSITGMLDGIVGDFDSMNGLDINDLDALVTHIGAAGNDAGFDVNGDNVVTADDIDAWLALKSADAGITFVGGDSDLDGSVAFADFLLLSGNFGNEGTNWSQGNYDGQNGTEFADFLTLSANFGTAPAGAESVPEPATGCFLLFVVLAGLRSRNARR